MGIRFQKQSRSSGMTFIEATVRATRALNMNAEQVAVFEDFTRVVQCAKRFRPTGTIHGDTPTEVNHHFLNLLLMPLPSKYSALPMK